MVKRPPPRHIPLVQEGRAERRQAVCETTSRKQNLALGKLESQEADVTEDAVFMTFAHCGEDALRRFSEGGQKSIHV